MTDTPPRDGQEMKRYRLSYRHGVISESGNDSHFADTSQPMYLCADADSVIAEKDARIAEWIAKHDTELFGRASDKYKYEQALAFRDAQLAEAREACRDVAWQLDALENEYAKSGVSGVGRHMQKRLRAALTPPPGEPSGGRANECRCNRCDQCAALADMKDAVLYDGYAVFEALTEVQRRFVSAEAVSAVLDAIVRVQRAALKEPPRG